MIVWVEEWESYAIYPDPYGNGHVFPFPSKYLCEFFLEHGFIPFPKRRRVELLNPKRK